MPVGGLNFDKIVVERYSTLKGKEVNITSNLSIKDIQKEPLPSVGNRKGDIALKLTFEFTVVYAPKISDMMFKGHIFYFDDLKKLDEVLKLWRKNKKLSNEVVEAVFNAILVKCNIKALVLSQDFNLPPPFGLPVLAKKEGPKQYIG